jgi:hypothetical protein
MDFSCQAWQHKVNKTRLHSRGPKKDSLLATYSMCQRYLLQILRVNPPKMHAWILEATPAPRSNGSLDGSTAF